MKTYDVVVIGGGLGGLTSALYLQKCGASVLVIEKNEYPFHRVCGEYISNEVRGYLVHLGVSFDELGVTEINQLEVSAPNGNLLKTPLTLGGFGISRYKLDDYLYKLAQSKGVEFCVGTAAETILFQENKFEITTTNNTIVRANYVIAAYGKRSKLDKILGRAFIEKRSPFVGIKYHIAYNFPKDKIALHNFKDGYCGISAIEDNKNCLCYLTHRSNLKHHKTIENLEKQVLSENPFLKEIFSNAEKLYAKPEVINEISFASKTAIENSLFMVGDTAGLIPPLCGNGMAMAIHAGKMASDCILSALNQEITRQEAENSYTLAWKKQFENRLWAGRNLQQLFGKNWLTNQSISLLKTQPRLLKKIISFTHGNEIII